MQTISLWRLGRTGPGLFRVCRYTYHSCLRIISEVRNQFLDIVGLLYIILNLYCAVTGAHYRSFGNMDVERFLVGGRSKIILLGQWVNLFTPVCQYPG